MGSLPPSTPVKTVGYIGLGKAGGSIAANIPRAGFHLVVRDADAEREKQFVAENATNTSIAAPGPEGFKDCDVVVTMLPQGKVVREVLLGEQGIASALKPGESCFLLAPSCCLQFNARGEIPRARGDVGD